MIFWLDAQLSPTLAVWLRMRFSLDATAVRELGLRDAEDAVIYAAARTAGAIVVTKDSDFVELLQRHGPPPQVLWLRCGNTSHVGRRRATGGDRRCLVVVQPHYGAHTETRRHRDELISVPPCLRVSQAV